MLNDALEVDGSFIPKDTKRVQERKELIDKFDKRIAKDFSFRYWASNNFLVAFEDTYSLEKKIGPERTPEALANFLEEKLAFFQNHFGVDLPDTFQVVNLVKGGIFRFIEGGTHLGGSKGMLAFKSYEHARFNKVIHKKRKNEFSDEPIVYQFAVHETIGHGYIEPVVLPSWEKLEQKPVQFLREGLATYIELKAVGVNLHDYMGKQILAAADMAFTDLFGGWRLGSLTEEELKAKFSRVQGYLGVKMDSIFKLRENTKIKKELLDYMNLHNYYGGGSFTTYMIDIYGIDKYKQWVKNINEENFISSLEEVTGKPIEDIEEEWKQIVLSGSVINNGMVEREEVKLDEAEKEKRFAMRQQIKEVFKKYS